MNKNYYNRRSIRLPGYDYSSPGYYFITLCSHKRLKLFGNIKNKKMELSDYGQIARNCLLEIPGHFENITLDEIIIMPEHIHGILIIKNKFSVVAASVGARHALPRQMQQQQQQFERFGKPTVGSIPTIIRSYKSAVTNIINCIREQNKPPVWQKNYYEHIILNDITLKKVRRYIINNPAQYGKS